MCALVTGVQTCALPILYGGIAARLANVPAFVAAISGPGYLFTRSRVRFDSVRWAAIGLYRLALGHANSRVIFKNTEWKSVGYGKRVSVRVELGGRLYLKKTTIS